MFDEFFLHYVWKHRLFDARNLKTMDGEELFIMDTGTENPLQGPDFMEGKIKIESKMWMGNIEIHVQASDWFRHSHQNDPVYQNVILHVVWSNDKPAIQVNGSKIPTIELRNRVFPFVLQNYKNLKESKKPIPCDPRWELIPIEKIEKQFFRTAEERLIRKSKEIETLLIREDWNWEMCFYKILVKSFGRSGNSSAFLQLAENLPLKLILKNRYDKLKTEALLFGQSGLLDLVNSEKGYCSDLLNEYAFLQRKHQLVPMNHSVWKFGKIRPGNFPTLRISQLADLFCKNEHFFSKAIQSDSVEQLRKLFQCKANEYWDTRYVFNQESDFLPKLLGKETSDSLLINAIIPIMYLYGKLRDSEEAILKSRKFLEDLAPEKNRLTKGFQKKGFTPKNAIDSQGMIECKQMYCERRRCLECEIGSWLVAN